MSGTICREVPRVFDATSGISWEEDSFFVYWMDLLEGFDDSPIVKASCGGASRW